MATLIRENTMSGRPGSDLTCFVNRKPARWRPERSRTSRAVSLLLTLDMHFRRCSGDKLSTNVPPLRSNWSLSGRPSSPHRQLTTDARQLQASTKAANLARVACKRLVFVPSPACNGSVTLVRLWRLIGSRQLRGSVMSEALRVRRVRIEFLLSDGSSLNVHLTPPITGEAESNA
jgi:hypothetical protein